MLRSTLSNWREYLTPISRRSTFERTGEITPEEFIAAGDYLCHMFPTWSWNESGPAVLVRDFLPENRQFLVTRKVPSNVRAGEFEAVGSGDAENEVDEYLMLEGTGTDDPYNTGEGKDPARSQQDIDDMLEDLELDSKKDLEDDSKDMIRLIPNSTRYYDLYITYSTSFRVPKMYLVGFNGDGTPLTPEEMFEDISPDYRTKTATIEKLPFLSALVVSVSIHPCRHAKVMRVLMEKVRTVRQRQQLPDNSGNLDNQEELGEARDDWEDLQGDLETGLRVDQYLVVFLKFISSVTPGIEHDYTMEGW